jgi:hypothetical protein
MKADEEDSSIYCNFLDNDRHLRAIEKKRK